MATVLSRMSPTEAATRRQGHHRCRRRYLRRLRGNAEETRLEPDLEDLLWSTVNLFHRATGRIERELDGNEQSQQKSQREQNGSEVRSVELERLTAEGITLIERRNTMELFRDLATEHFEMHTGSPRRPRSGSTGQSSHADIRRSSTAAIFSPPGAAGGNRDDDAARAQNRPDRWTGFQRLSPDLGPSRQGSRQASRTWFCCFGGSPKGAELIAAKWAGQPQGPANRIQAGLDQARQGSAVQAQ